MSPRFAFRPGLADPRLGPLPRVTISVTLLSRRALFARTVLAAAAGAGIARLPLAGHPARYGALTPAHRAAYAGMVAQVVRSEGGSPGRSYTSRATEAFAGWYERNPNLRPMADHLLVGTTRRGGPRRSLDAEARALASPPFAPDRA